eukprot:c6169_g1_i1.p1 GENE.c6169_g1_i1~~c6169_g1_i1.p1  ORF type:complete len:583 (+),score=130.09 c6169_g1_i1:35-1750(+)
MEGFACSQCARALVVTVPQDNADIARMNDLLTRMSEPESSTILDRFTAEMTRFAVSSPAQIEIESGILGSYVRFSVNSETIKPKDGSEFSRGINFVCLDRDTHSVLETKSFDVFQRSKAARYMTSWITGLPADRIVLVAVRCEQESALDTPGPTTPQIASVSAHEAALDSHVGTGDDLRGTFEALRLIGGTGIDIAPGQSFVMVGVRGSSPGSAQERIGSDNAPATIQVDTSQLSTVGAASGVDQCVSMAQHHAQQPMPLCPECLVGKLKDLRNQAEVLDDQLATYKATREELNVVSTETPRSSSGQEENTHIMLQELKRKEQLLDGMRAKSETLKQERFEIMEMARELDMLEKQYWADLNDLELTALRVQEQRDGVTQEVDIFSNHLEELRQTNVLNDAFHIWVDGHFATINGFRLGSLPSLRDQFKVEWDEINAALGQTVLLLVSIADFVGYEFKGYSLRARGSFSKIFRRDDRAEAVLHGPPGFFAKALMADTPLNRGLTWLLGCVQELAVYIQSKDPSFQLHYGIENDTIGALSVKYGNDELWTRAMKYLLTNLKCLLLGAVKVGSR